MFNSSAHPLAGTKDSTSRYLIDQANALTSHTSGGHLEIGVDGRAVDTDERTAFTNTSYKTRKRLTE